MGDFGDQFGQEGCRVRATGGAGAGRRPGQGGRLGQQRLQADRQAIGIERLLRHQPGPAGMENLPQRRRRHPVLGRELNPPRRNRSPTSNCSWPVCQTSLNWQRYWWRHWRGAADDTGA